MAKQPRVNKKETEVTKEVASGATMPPAAPQDPTKDKEASKMEIVLASLPIPAKGKEVDQGSLEAIVQQSRPRPKEKL